MIEDRIETYKEMYARVYSVILEIKLSKDRSAAYLFQLFFKVLDHGFEKFDMHFPNLFSSVVISTSFVTEPYTFLNFAAQRGYTDLLQYILYRGAGVNTTIPRLKTGGTLGVHTNTWLPGKSALMYAVKANETKCVSLLIEAKAELDYKTSSGDTALHKAGRKGYADCVAELLKAGASTNITNVWGYRALDVTKNSQCRQMLMEAMKKSKESLEPSGECLVM
ncbi:MAG: ankyrin repeat domain-containing protein [Proteobacteria bacterium]|nr:ankyrin repeat domain-containing protein [Pseudomonadota bacterium]